MEQSKPNTEKTLLVFFGITFLFSWLVWLVGILASVDRLTMSVPNMVFVIIGAHGPLIASFSITYRNKGWAGVKNLLFSGFNLKMKLIWWIVIIILPFVLSALAMNINITQSDFQPDQTLLRQPVLILPTFLMMFFLGGSVQEEFGWRGFALPRMLGKWNPLVASLILGALWGLWHLPLFFISGTGQSFMPFGIFFLLSISFSILFTWLYLETNNNLFSALLFHTAINTSLSVFPPIEQKMGGNQMAFTYLMIGYGIIALFVVVKDRSLWFSAALRRRPIPR